MHERWSEILGCRVLLQLIQVIWAFSQGGKSVMGVHLPALVPGLLLSARRANWEGLNTPQSPPRRARRISVNTSPVSRVTTCVQVDLFRCQGKVVQQVACQHFAVSDYHFNLRVAVCYNRPRSSQHNQRLQCPPSTSLPHLTLDMTTSHRYHQTHTFRQAAGTKKPDGPD
jgi:hypothetical protein